MPSLFPAKLKFCYGVGHVLNDLTAAMWFSYMLIFMHKVVAFTNVNAGFIILAGQIADALATTFVGYQSDTTVNVKYGRRKIWHLLGVICVAISFPFIFSLCISNCANSSPSSLMIYYIPFVVIFQFGWASTQISHLSLIPEITTCEQGKVELNAYRYFFTVLSNLIVFGVCFTLFQMNNTGTEALTKADAFKFQVLAVSMVGLGLLFMIIFHVGVKEEPVGSLYSVSYGDEEATSLAASIQSVSCQKTIKSWFKTPLFYQVGWLYMMTRLIVNVSQIYISYFVLDSLKLPKSSIAIAPAIIYVSGILASILAKLFNRKLGLKLTYLLGLCLITASSVWFYELEELSSRFKFEAYGATVFLGMGGSTLLIVSLAMISEMIDKNTDTAAFVYGSMSFLDKISNGGAVMIIQYLQPCKSIPICCKDCQEYFRYIMSLVPGSCAVLALICLLTLIKSPFGSFKKKEKNFQNTKYGSLDSKFERNSTIQS
uniref:Uncharacterized MFS-type transporter C19orf28 n=1 Tax=Hydra vulgaris TaxID=6087 RepID=T2MBB1_HYDVU